MVNVGRQEPTETGEHMKSIFALVTLLTMTAQAQCPSNPTAIVRAAAYSRATDSLTYCGTRMEIVEVLSTDECSLAASEILNQKVFLNNGHLMNGHDCETPLHAGDILILKIEKAGSSLRVVPENSNLE
jgi:hypothetical protein